MNNEKLNIVINYIMTNINKVKIVCYFEEGSEKKSIKQFMEEIDNNGEIQSVNPSKKGGYYINCNDYCYRIK